MLTFGENFSEIVELPVIVKNNQVELIDPEMLQLDSTVLKVAAKMMHGELCYLKVRATYSPVEGSLICTEQGCYQLSNNGSLRCEGHG